MSKHLGPIEIECDAPAYTIVQAAKPMGISTPEDVRWIKLNSFSESLPTSERKCSCGESLPDRSKVIFTFGTQGQMSFVRLGQCCRCRTVYWETPYRTPDRP
jgi:hypothetical protein